MEEFKRTAIQKRLYNRKIAFTILCVCCALFVVGVIVHDTAIETKNLVQQISKNTSEHYDKDIKPIKETVDAIGENIFVLAKENTGLPEMKEKAESIPIVETEEKKTTEKVFSSESFDKGTPTITKGTVLQIIDGETLLIKYNDSNKESRIRLIGVDVPEKIIPSDYSEEEKYADMDVAEIVNTYINVGDNITLDYDNLITDKYDRTLAYVTLSNGTMLQEWLLENGYAEIKNDGVNTKYIERFQKLADKAKENKIGLWNGYFKES